MLSTTLLYFHLVRKILGIKAVITTQLYVCEVWPLTRPE
jgi:hypothetical protein